MKKIVTLYLFLFSSVILSQKFEVTNKGLRDTDNIEKNYLVLNIENKTVKELYQITLKYMGNNYLNPNTILKDKAENKYVLFETSIKEFGMVKNSGSEIPIGAKYIIELRFKENKVKFTILDLIMGNGAYEVLWQGDVFEGYVIWNENGEFIRQELKVFIEDYFNKEAYDLKTYLSTYKDEDDW